MADKVDQQVIDEFRRDSLLLDMLTFDDTVSPGTGGSTLTYGYTRLKSPSTVAVRKINTEYAPGEAKREKATADLVILGGAFEVDRVIAETGGAVDEIDFQLKEKTKAGANYFHNLVINGCTASTGAGYVTDTFDGLKKILSGSDTEFTSESDISTSELFLTKLLTNNCRGRVFRPDVTDNIKNGTGDLSPTVKYGDYDHIFIEISLFVYLLKYPVKTIKHLPMLCRLY